MFLPNLSIRRPVLASMMSLALILFGVIGLRQLPVRELPDIDPPIVSVTTIYPGANAEVVETEVTERLEEEINNIEGIKTLSSQSREQVSNITIEFDLKRNIDVAAQDVRDRVSRVRGLLPESIKEPVIAKQEADASPVIWVGVYSERYSPLELSTLAERQIKNRLQTVKGVSSVIIGGEQRFAMRLWLDSEKMAARQVTVLDVQRSLRQQNVELPSGRIENLEREMTIETRGEMKTADEFNAMVIKSDGTKIVRLRDIGRAEAGVEDYRTVARANGKKCIFLGIVKQSKANTIEVAHGVRAEINAVKPLLPQGIETVFNYDESVYVEQAVDEVWLTLGIAFVLVVLVIFMFLRDVRSTIIPAIAVPVSIVATFAILNLLGFSINILTMLALVLSIGIVVDDAIVVLENIFRHIEKGEPPMQAAFKAMDEIGFAILAITFSLVAVFLPLAFQHSATGRLFLEFAVAVAGSVLVSAFVALSLSPMMSARILKPVHGRQHGKLFLFFEHGFDAVHKGYRGLLGWSLRHRLLVIIGAAVTLVLMVLAISNLQNEFLPEEDKGRLLCILQTPEGSTSEYTDRIAQKAEAIVREIPETESMGSVVAPAFSGPGRANFAFVFVRFKADRKRTLQQIVDGPRGLKARLWTEVQGGFAIANIPKAIGRSFNAPFQLVIQGPDLESLNKFSMRLAAKLNQTGYLINVQPSFKIDKPELTLNIDRNRAAALGVSIEDISRTMQIMFGGLDLSRIKVGGKEYEVIAQLARESRLKPEDLDRLYVRNAKNELIQLSSIVTKQSGAAPNTIEHYSRLRSSTISGTPIGLPMGTVIDNVEGILRNELPTGFTYRWEGEARDLKESGQEIMFVFILALVIVYMVLAAQFESLIHPLTVMLAVPLAAFGAFGLLWILSEFNKLGWTHIPAMNINLFSEIGLVLLVGLVTKNSILLVDYANQQIAKGVKARDAMIEAGAVRLRPILMTALATIAGIMPIAIGFGAGAESRRPMGIAVVGGMLTSTFLTLLVIPVVYTVFSDMADWLRRTKGATTVPSEPVTAK